jgi:hypothetical protein
MGLLNLLRDEGRRSSPGEPTAPLTAQAWVEGSGRAPWHRRTSASCSWRGGRAVQRPYPRRLGYLLRWAVTPG